VSWDDPPVWLSYSDPPRLGLDQKDPTHTANYGVKLQQKCKAIGTQCELVYPGAPAVLHPTAQDYLIKMLKQKATRDLPYAASGNPRQKVDIYAPEGAHDLPVVFWIHGGGWQAGDRSSVQFKPEVFVDKGYVFVSTGYRLLPEVEMVEIFRDIAKSLAWVHGHIAEYGGDPNRILVMGHSAGAQLAALVCIDERYLKAEGITSLEFLKGCVPVDGDTYDVPAIIETAETRRRVHGQPQAKLGHREKFGSDPAKHRDYSAVTHVARGKTIPPFLILHVADHPDTSAQAERLASILKENGISVQRFAARDTHHSLLNENLGLPDDPATRAMFEFADAAVKK
jgi:acetyl esterase/lipase